MSFEPHTLVMLLAARAEVPEGSCGHIVEECGHDYEVEFLLGREIVRVLVPECDLETAEPLINRCS